VLRQLLKSKIHRACVTDANVDYEGSISLPTDLMEQAGLWAGEKVLVASISRGGRLETYVQPGPPGTGRITINGGAAHLIGRGERITIMSYALSTEPIAATRLLCDEFNRVLEADTLGVNPAVDEPLAV